MKNDDPRLDTLAAAISDGIPVDWDTAESAAQSTELREILRNLRAISNLAGVHRTIDPGSTPLPAPRPDSSTSSSRALAHWGAYALLEPLGHGSQGVVYRALDTRLNREVALKLRPRDGTADAVLHEARLLARLRHPNIVTIFGAEEFEGQTGIAMELVSGETLDQIVRRQGPMNAGEATLIGLDLARAVDAVHQAGLLHRDIKAQNVMREAGGRYVLMDFGTGREADAPEAARAGTPLYLAPEVLAGGGASVESEVYSLGVLIYYLVTGAFPVSAPTLDQLQVQHRDGGHKPLRDLRSDLPANFVRVIDQAIAPRASDRFASMMAFHRALADTLPAAVVQPRRRWESPWLAVGLIAAALAIALVARIGPGGGTPRSIARVTTLAVLPFQDVSGTGANEVIGLGLADMLITDLGSHTPLRVIARSSITRTLGPQRISERARDLGIDALIEGSVRRDGDALVVAVRLAEASGGSLIWSETFTSTGPWPALGAEISERVAGALDTEFTRIGSAPQSAPSSAALDEYFRGWAEYYNNITPPSMVKVAEHFTKTIQLAPDFAPAYAALAYVKSVQASSFDIGVLDEQFQAATQLVEEARRLDPTLGYAEAVHAWIRLNGHRDWTGAEQGYLRAIEMNPSDPEVHHLYALFLMAQNRLDAALMETKLAQQLDPLNETRLSQIAICHYYARDYEQATAASQQLLAQNPGSDIARVGLARFYSAVGRYDEALTMIRTLPNMRDLPGFKAEEARILYAAGRGAEADALLPGLERAYRDRRLSPDFLAYVELARGRPDAALALLREAIDLRRTSVIWIHVDPRFDGLRGDLRFRALEQELGLVH